MWWGGSDEENRSDVFVFLRGQLTLWGVTQEVSGCLLSVFSLTNSDVVNTETRTGTMAGRSHGNQTAGGSSVPWIQASGFILNLLRAEYQRGQGGVISSASSIMLFGDFVFVVRIKCFPTTWTIKVFYIFKQEIILTNKQKLIVCVCYTECASEKIWCKSLLWAAEADWEIKGSETFVCFRNSLFWNSNSFKMQDPN